MPRAVTVILVVSAVVCLAICWVVMAMNDRYSW